ncbi:XRE family transcriptional regulator [Nitratireductor mangrovi]|uniref:XRE family transcriptional regulator n=1 Tax=Nitratireductor mangrovi TaxID=2599600 RepID=UPI0011B14871|nr:XRE family transcriptional regulator [Nitratireductor mangrovi]
MGRPAKTSPGLGERLKSLRQGKTRTEFASIIGVHENTLGGYERGERSPEWGFLTQLRETTGVDLNWLVEGNGTHPIQRGDSGAGGGFLPIPKLDVRPSAGPGALVPQPLPNDDEVVAFREDWLRRIGVSPRFARLMFARGDSMHDTISDGDMMIVDVSIREIVDEGVYVVVYGGLVIVKRVQLLRTGGIVLKSDNPRYEPETVPVDEQPELIVEGRVRWVGGEL